MFPGLAAGRTGAGSLGLGLVLLGKARLAASHIVQGVQADFAFFHAAGVADGGEAVSAFGDVFRLGIAYFVIHSGKIKKDVRQHSDKSPGSFGAAAGIAFGQVPEKHRRQERLIHAHGTGQVPQEPAGPGLVAGVYFVCHGHMALAYTAAPAPEAEGAACHKFVQLLCQSEAADAVKRVGIGRIYFVKFLRGAIPGCGHGVHLLTGLYAPIINQNPAGSRALARRVKKIIYDPGSNGQPCPAPAFLASASSLWFLPPQRRISPLLPAARRTQSP